MKTKKALGGLFGLLGSFAAFFVCFLPAPAPLRFKLKSTKKRKNKQKLQTNQQKLDRTNQI